MQLCCITCLWYNSCLYNFQINLRMIPEIDNKFVFQGKVIEVINYSQNRIIKVLCKPESIVIESVDDSSLNLGDTVNLTGTYKVDNINIQTKNHLTN